MLNIIGKTTYVFNIKEIFNNKKYEEDFNLHFKKLIFYSTF